MLMNYWSNGYQTYEVADAACRTGLTEESARAQAESVAIEKFLTKFHPGYSVGEMKTDGDTAIAF